jgi:hypothetical protein
MSLPLGRQAAFFPLPMALRDYREVLQTPDSPEWCRVAGKVLQELPPGLALRMLFFSLLESRWDELREHLGESRAFWEWCLSSARSDWDAGIPQGGGILLSEFWRSQGFSVRVSRALSRASVRSREELSRMSDKDLLKLRTLGKAGVAEIRRRLEPAPKA